MAGAVRLNEEDGFARLEVRERMAAVRLRPPESHECGIAGVGA